MRIPVLLRSLLVLATLILVAAGAFSSRQSPEASTLGKCATQGAHVAHDTALDYGMHYKAKAMISKPLIDPETNTSVIVLAFHLEVGGLNAVGMAEDRLEYLDPSSCEPLTFDFSPIFPEIVMGKTLAGTPPVSYVATVFPNPTKSWSTIGSLADLHIDFVRTQ